MHNVFVVSIWSGHFFFFYFTALFEASSIYLLQKQYKIIYISAMMLPWISFLIGTLQWIDRERLVWRNTLIREVLVIHVHFEHFCYFTHCYRFLNASLWKFSAVLLISCMFFKSKWAETTNCVYGITFSIFKWSCKHMWQYIKTDVMYHCLHKYWRIQRFKTLL